MKEIYNQIIQYMFTAGRRIKEKAGHIEDIGVKKSYLTQEDIEIERDIQSIILHFDPTHKLFAEEENTIFPSAENVWVLDPISGTKTFLDGVAHYAIVISHLFQGETVFAAVYDPSVDEMFTTYKGKGIFLNNQKILPSEMGPRPRVLFNLSSEAATPQIVEKTFQKLSDTNLFRNRNSFGVNYAHVACGRYDGVVTLGKDSFTEFAGRLFIEESGKIFTNKEGKRDIDAIDTVFVAGKDPLYSLLKKKLDEAFV